MKKLYIIFITLFNLNSINAQNLTGTVFKENFKTDNGWGIFEELVGGNSCYDDSLGEVIRSNDYFYSDSTSLRVWANKTLSKKSNHVLGNKKIDTVGLYGKYLLSCYAFIPPESDTGMWFLLWRWDL